MGIGAINEERSTDKSTRRIRTAPAPPRGPSRRQGRCRPPLIGTFEHHGVISTTTIRTHHIFNRHGGGGGGWMEPVIGYDQERNTASFQAAMQVRTVGRQDRPGEARAPIGR